MSTDNTLTDKDTTTIPIEKIDESWALKLLNESQSEPNTLNLDETKHTAQQACEATRDNKVLGFSENETDTHILVSESESDEITLKLSAIENQIFIHSQKKYEMKNTEKKGFLINPLAKIKSFFAA